MNKDLRNTSQREKILSYLQQVNNHPTAKQIYQEIKKELPHLSLATVYRNLDFLADQGLVQLVDENPKRFDGNTECHSHLVCEKCGRIYDVFEEFSVYSKEKVKKGKVNNCEICFYGVCKNCLKGGKND
jgi:Fe2+ or Zn2+ uptake regulation protein